MAWRTPLKLRSAQGRWGMLYSIKRTPFREKYFDASVGQFLVGW
jgi:hypothetical protein